MAKNMLKFDFLRGQILDKCALLLQTGQCHEYAPFWSCLVFTRILVGYLKQKLADQTPVGVLVYKSWALQPGRFYCFLKRPYLGGARG